MIVDSVIINVAISLICWLLLFWAILVPHIVETTIENGRFEPIGFRTGVIIVSLMACLIPIIAVFSVITVFVLILVHASFKGITFHEMLPNWKKSPLIRFLVSKF